MRITTKQELIDFITEGMRSAKTSEGTVTLYAALYMSKHIEEFNFYPSGAHIGRYIYDGKESASEFLYVRISDSGGWIYESLVDRNITGHHNDNWWFTSREEAEDYLDPQAGSIRTVRSLLEKRGITESGTMSLIRDMGWNNKIKCIKAIRTITGSGLKEAKDYFEYHDTQRGNDEYYSGDQTLGDILNRVLQRN